MIVPVKTYHHRDISGTSATRNPITGRDILSLDALRCENSSLQYRSELSSLKDLWPSSRDPADRIIGATARAHGLPIITKVERLQKSSLLQTIWQVPAHAYPGA